METRTPGGSGEPPSFSATLDPADVLALRVRYVRLMQEAERRERRVSIVNEEER